MVDKFFYNLNFKNHKITKIKNQNTAISFIYKYMKNT